METTRTSEDVLEEIKLLDAELARLIEEYFSMKDKELTSD